MKRLAGTLGLPALGHARLNAWHARGPIPPSAHAMGLMIDPTLVFTPRRVQAGSPLPPLPPELISALKANDAAALRACLAALPLDVNQFFATEQGTRSLAQCAAYHAASEVVAALLELGADPRAASPDDGSTALHCACSRPSAGTTHVLRLLLAAGACLDATDAAGRTPRDLLSLEPASPGQQVRRSGAPRVPATCLAIGRAGPASTLPGPFRPQAGAEGDAMEDRSDDFRMFSFKAS